MPTVWTFPEPVEYKPRYMNTRFISAYDTAFGIKINEMGSKTTVWTPAPAP